MIHIFDGATGTMLQAAGLKAGECPELVNLCLLYTSDAADEL